jgi:CIC family chloride channel protein
VIRTFQPLLARLHNRFAHSTQLYMVVVALIIGVLGGYGAIGFRVLIRAFQGVFWQVSEYSHAYIQSLPWWWVVGAPAAGGLACGLIVHYFASEAKGHGVPEVMEAVALREGRIRPRVVVAKALASSLSIASGGSVGREGPIVQIGAALGSSIGQALGVGPGRMRTFTGCGAAAGIAATFNAPIAGALFAVEVVLGDFGVAYFSPIVLASVAATVVSRSYLGNFPMFELPGYTTTTPWELVAYATLGVLAALVAIAFIETLNFAEDRFEELPMALPMQTMLGGALVGLIALAYPGVLGVGHESVNAALHGNAAWTLLAPLLVAKLLAVSITLGSGGSGGIFAPSLFLGATLGALVGIGADVLFPGQTAPPGAYALVGMGAVVGATTHAPITAILIIFELTNEYAIILPLMTSCITATLLSQRLHPESIYTIKLLRRGVNLRAGQDINVLRSVRVRDIMHEEPATVPASMPLADLLRAMARSQQHCFYVVDNDGRLDGVVSMNELQSLMPDAETLADLVLAADVASHTWPTVGPRDTLDAVLREFDGDYRPEIPVVEDGCLLGTVRTEELLVRYRHEVFKREMAQSLEHRPARRGG